MLTLFYNVGCNLQESYGLCFEQRSEFMPIRFWIDVNC